jgi:phenylalanyl-tRNA synthetase beta chain
MPTVDVDYDDLRTLTGHDEKSDDELEWDLFNLGVEYEGETDDGKAKLELESDRLDRLSVEGMARSLRYQYGDDRGVAVPSTNDPDWTIRVEGVPRERPYVTGAVVRGLDLDEGTLDSIIQLQEKLHATMGRKRAKGAIGIHDLTMLKGADVPVAAEESSEDVTDPRDGGATAEETANSIRYTGVDPDGDRFVPLDADREMTPAGVLGEHPTGETYADLVADYESMPAIYDDIGLFSFPPVINGRRTEVTTDSRDLFVEMTGTDQWTIDKMLNIVCYALSARGGTVEEVRVSYPDADVYADDRVDLVEPGVDLVRPDLSTTEKTVAHERIESLLGISLDPREVVDLAERSGLDAERTEVGDDELAYEVTVPPYRVDVLHPLDVVDDVGRAYGFNDLTPRYPEVGTVGGRHERSRRGRAVRETLVGVGFEDTLNFHLTGRSDNYDRMNVAPGDDVLGGGEAPRITDPYSEDYGVVRTWALPSLCAVLGNNTHRSYPQHLAEVGLATRVDENDPTNVAERRTVAGVVAEDGASYEDARSRLRAVARSFGADLETPATDHPSFLDGRCAEVVLDGESAGVVGELHPEVIVAHDVEVPVAAFEFRLDALAE